MKREQLELEVNRLLHEWIATDTRPSRYAAWLLLLKIWLWKADDGEDHHQQEKPDLAAHHIGRQEVTAEDRTERQRRRQLGVFLLRLLLDLLDGLFRLFLNILQSILFPS